MALPSATSVCQDVRHTRAHYAVHTHLAETHISRTASDHSVASAGTVRLLCSVRWSGIRVRSRQNENQSGKKNNSRAAEKWVTGLQTFRRVVQCQQDVFRVKKKKSSVCDILSEKMEYLLNRFNISAHTCRTFYSLGISPHPMQTLVQNILHSVYWGIRCVFALMQICQMSLKSHEIICLVQGAS